LVILEQSGLLIASKLFVLLNKYTSPAIRVKQDKGARKYRESNLTNRLPILS